MEILLCRGWKLTRATLNIYTPVASFLCPSTHDDGRLGMCTISRRLQPLFGSTLPFAASLVAPTMSAPAGVDQVAHERLRAAMSEADALPRGTAFDEVKGARDRLREELSSVKRVHGDKELAKCATACAHRLSQRLSRMRKLGMDGAAKTEPAAVAEAPIATTTDTAMSSVSVPLCAIQNLRHTLATAPMPGRCETYKLIHGQHHKQC